MTRPEFKALWILSAAAAGVCVASVPVSAQHEGDVFVGRTAAGQLKIGGFLPDLNVVVLPPVSGLFNGWSDNDPGFDRVVQPQPEQDLFPLESGAQIRLECLALDAAFRAISPSLVVVDAPGESVLLGGSGLHIHLTWHINSDSPAFDPLQVLWKATFKLLDTGSTGYAESAPFTFRFANVACLRGDVNQDMVIDGQDVGAFVAVLLDPASASASQRCAADADRSGFVTPDDVPAFAELLLSQ